MTNFKVSRSHLKKACDEQNWDLLDKLLEIDNKNINDNALYTDTWGEWWGMLMHCIFCDYPTGVRVLLKHGANKDAGTWGDCMPLSPLDAAEAKPEILQLLKSSNRPDYCRTTDPHLPDGETEEDIKLRKQDRIRKETGLIFPIESIDDK